MLISDYTQIIYVAKQLIDYISQVYNDPDYIIHHL